MLTRLHIIKTSQAVDIYINFEIGTAFVVYLSTNVNEGIFDMKPDRLTIYLALAVIASGIAAVTGPSLALLTLVQIVLVVELINLIAAPGDESPASLSTLGASQGE